MRSHPGDSSFQMSHLLICLMDRDKSSECIHLSISLLSGWGGTEGFIPNFPLNESFDRVMAARN